MKKIVVLMMALVVMAFGAVCSASAAPGSDLTKELKAADIFMDGMLDRSPTTTYDNVVAVANAGLKANLTNDAYDKAKATIKDTYGKYKSVQFRSFERFADGDRVVFLGQFNKEEMVAVIFVFDTNGQVNEFTTTRLKKVEQPAQGQAAPAAPATPAE